MCNCINEVEQKISEAYEGKFKGKPIEKISLQKVTPFRIQGGEIKEPKVSINFTIERVGVKSKATEIIVATYCPFCGEEYDKDEVTS